MSDMRILVVLPVSEEEAQELKETAPQATFMFKALVKDPERIATTPEFELTDEEIAAIMADDSNCILSFTLTMEDSRSVTYRFFPYSERHCMVSVSGDGIKGVSLFYTSSASVRHIADATGDLVSGVKIDADRRY